MDDKPDLRFDIDALFDHLVKRLNHDIADEKDWNFTLRSNSLQKLQRIADELEGEFAVRLQEEVEEYHVDGSVTIGNPMLIAVRRSALTVDEVKQIADQVQQIATEHGLTYEGVDCYDPIDEEELFGWLAPADAGWRLRHMTDCGLDENADLPWTFLIQLKSPTGFKSMLLELDSNNLSDRDEYDEPDEHGQLAICVFVQGRNNEIELDKMADRIAKIAERNGGQLEGVQFYTREELNEVFGLDGIE